MGTGRKKTMGLRSVHELLDVGVGDGPDGADWGRHLAHAPMVDSRGRRNLAGAALLDGEYGAIGRTGSAAVVNKLLIGGAIGLGVWAIAKILSPGDAEAAVPGVDTPDGYLLRDFDQVFVDECGRYDIPVEYLRALAKKESDFNAGQSKGGAWGLLQVVNNVRTDYNKKFGTNYSSDERLDPSINARMACELLGRITQFLPRQDPGAFANGEFSWSSRRDVKLLTLAWNAGWSTKGVSGMIRHLLRDGYSRSQITTDAILDQAHKYSNITPFLRNWKTEKPKVKGWLNAIANYYFHELRGANV